MNGISQAFADLGDEVERLRGQVDTWRFNYEQAQAALERREAEVERLRAAIDAYIETPSHKTMIRLIEARHALSPTEEKR